MAPSIPTSRPIVVSSDPNPPFVQETLIEQIEPSQQPQQEIQQPRQEDVIKPWETQIRKSGGRYVSIDVDSGYYWGVTPTGVRERLNAATLDNTPDVYAYDKRLVTYKPPTVTPEKPIVSYRTPEGSIVRIGPESPDYAALAIGYGERPITQFPTGTTKKELRLYSEAAASQLREKYNLEIPSGYSYNEIQDIYNAPNQTITAQNIYQSLLPKKPSPRYVETVSEYDARKYQIVSSGGNLVPTYRGYVYATGNVDDVGTFFEPTSPLQTKTSSQVAPTAPTPYTGITEKDITNLQSTIKSWFGEPVYSAIDTVLRSTPVLTGVYEYGRKYGYEAQLAETQSKIETYEYEHPEIVAAQTWYQENQGTVEQINKDYKSLDESAFYQKWGKTIEEMPQVDEKQHASYFKEIDKYQAIQGKLDKLNVAEKIVPYSEEENAWLATAGTAAIKKFTGIDLVGVKEANIPVVSQQAGIISGIINAPAGVVTPKYWMNWYKDAEKDAKSWTNLWTGGLKAIGADFSTPEGQTVPTVFKGKGVGYETLGAAAKLTLDIPGSTLALPAMVGGGLWVIGKDISRGEYLSFANKYLPYAAVSETKKFVENPALYAYQFGVTYAAFEAAGPIFRATTGLRYIKSDIGTPYVRSVGGRLGTWTGLQKVTGGEATVRALTWTNPIRSTMIELGLRPDWTIGAKWKVLEGGKVGVESAFPVRTLLARVSETGRSSLLGGMHYTLPPELAAVEKGSIIKGYTFSEVTRPTTYTTEFPKGYPSGVTPTVSIYEGLTPRLTLQAMRENIGKIPGELYSGVTGIPSGIRGEFQYRAAKITLTGVRPFTKGLRWNFRLFDEPYLRSRFETTTVGKKGDVGTQFTFLETRYIKPEELTKYKNAMDIVLARESPKSYKTWQELWKLEEVSRATSKEALPKTITVEEVLRTADWLTPEEATKLTEILRGSSKEKPSIAYGEEPSVLFGGAATKFWFEKTKKLSDVDVVGSSEAQVKVLDEKVSGEGNLIDVLTGETGLPSRLDILPRKPTTIEYGVKPEEPVIVEPGFSIESYHEAVMSTAFRSNVPMVDPLTGKIELSYKPTTGKSTVDFLVRVLPDIEKRAGVKFDVLKQELTKRVVEMPDTFRTVEIYPRFKDYGYTLETFTESQGIDLKSIREQVAAERKAAAGFDYSETFMREQVPEYAKVPGGVRVIAREGGLFGAYEDVTAIVGHKTPGPSIKINGEFIELKPFKSSFHIAEELVTTEVPLPATLKVGAPNIQTFDPFGTVFGETKVIPERVVSVAERPMVLWSIGMQPEKFAGIVLREGYLPQMEAPVTIRATYELLKTRGILKEQLPKMPEEFTKFTPEETAMGLSDVYKDIQTGKITTAEMFMRQLAVIETVWKDIPKKPTVVVSPYEVIMRQDVMKEQVRTGYIDYIERIAPEMRKQVGSGKAEEVYQALLKIREKYPELQQYSPEVLKAIAYLKESSKFEGVMDIHGGKWSSPDYLPWLPQNRVVAEAILHEVFKEAEVVKALKPGELEIVASAIRGSGKLEPKYASAFKMQDLSKAVKLADEMVGGKVVRIGEKTILGESGVLFEAKPGYFRDTIPTVPAVKEAVTTTTLGELILNTIKEEFPEHRLGGSFAQETQMMWTRGWGDIDLYVKDVELAQLRLREIIEPHRQLFEKHGWKYEDYTGLYDIHEIAKPGSFIGRFGIKTEKDIRVEDFNIMPLHEQALRKATQIAEVRVKDTSFYTGVEPHRGKDIADVVGIMQESARGLASDKLYQKIMEMPYAKSGEPFVDYSTTLVHAYGDIVYGTKITNLSMAFKGIEPMFAPEYIPKERVGGLIYDPLESAIGRLEKYHFELPITEYRNIPFTKRWVKWEPQQFETITKPIKDIGGDISGVYGTTKESAINFFRNLNDADLPIGMKTKFVKVTPDELRQMWGDYRTESFKVEKIRPEEITNLVFKPEWMVEDVDLLYQQTDALVGRPQNLIIEEFRNYLDPFGRRYEDILPERSARGIDFIEHALYDWPRYRMVALKPDLEIVGAMSFYESETLLGTKPVPMTYLDIFGTKYPGRGVGREMIGALEQFSAKEIGSSIIRLQPVPKERQTYLNIGFEQIPAAIGGMRKFIETGQVLSKPIKYIVAPETARIQELIEKYGTKPWMMKFDKEGNLVQWGEEKLPEGEKPVKFDIQKNIYDIPPLEFPSKKFYEPTQTYYPKVTGTFKYSDVDLYTGLVEGRIPRIPESKMDVTTGFRYTETPSDYGALRLEEEPYPLPTSIASESMKPIKYVLFEPGIGAEGLRKLATEDVNYDVTHWGLIEDDPSAFANRFISAIIEHEHLYRLFGIRGKEIVGAIGFEKDIIKGFGVQGIKVNWFGVKERGSGIGSEMLKYVEQFAFEKTYGKLIELAPIDISKGWYYHRGYQFYKPGFDLMDKVIREPVESDIKPYLVYEELPKKLSIMTIQKTPVPGLVTFEGGVLGAGISRIKEPIEPVRYMFFKPGEGQQFLGRVLKYPENVVMAEASLSNFRPPRGHVSYIDYLSDVMWMPEELDKIAFMSDVLAAPELSRLVAFRGKTIVGAIGFKPSTREVQEPLTHYTIAELEAHPQPKYLQIPGIEVVRFGVFEEGSGIGSRMLGFVERQALEEGKQFVFIESSEYAQKFYQNRKYVQIGTQLFNKELAFDNLIPTDIKPITYTRGMSFKRFAEADQKLIDEYIKKYGTKTWMMKFDKEGNLIGWGEEKPTYIGEKEIVVERDIKGELVDFQEGRHRAVAALELGVTKLPVWEMHQKQPDLVKGGYLIPDIFKQKTISEVTHPTLKTYLTKDMLEKYTTWGGESQYTAKESGELIKNVVEDINKVPPLLYHVTTNLKAVVDEGVLKHIESGAGLGKGTSIAHKGVSFTTSVVDAQMIQMELTRIVEIAKGKPFEEAIKEWQRIDERIAKVDLTKPVEAALEDYRWRVEHKESLLPETSAIEASRLYRIMRQGETKGILQDPIIFGGVEKFKDVDIENIGIVTTTTSLIPEGAVVRKPLGDFMHEIMVHADVPIDYVVKLEPHMIRGIIDKILPKIDKILPKEKTTAEKFPEFKFELISKDKLKDITTPKELQMFLANLPTSVENWTVSINNIDLGVKPGPRTPTMVYTGEYTSELEAHAKDSGIDLRKYDLWDKWIEKVNTIPDLLLIREPKKEYNIPKEVMEIRDAHTHPNMFEAYPSIQDIVNINYENLNVRRIIASKSIMDIIPKKEIPVLKTHILGSLFRVYPITSNVPSEILVLQHLAKKGIVDVNVYKIAPTPTLTTEQLNKLIGERTTAFTLVKMPEIITVKQPEITTPDLIELINPPQEANALATLEMFKPVKIRELMQHYGPSPRGGIKLDYLINVERVPEPIPKELSLAPISAFKMISPQEIKSIKWYIADYSIEASTEINKFLRRKLSSYETNEGIRTVVDRILQGMEPTTKPAVIYRGVGGKEATKIADAITKGTFSTFKDYGFISFSKDFDVAKTFADYTYKGELETRIILRNILKPGEFAIDRRVGFRPSFEEEVILPPGEFKVEKITPVDMVWSDTLEDWLRVPMTKEEQINKFPAFVIVDIHRTKGTLLPVNIRDVKDVVPRVIELPGITDVNYPSEYTLPKYPSIYELPRYPDIKYKSEKYPSAKYPKATYPKGYPFGYPITSYPLGYPSGYVGTTYPKPYGKPSYDISYITGYKPGKYPTPYPLGKYQPYQYKPSKYSGDYGYDYGGKYAYNVVYGSEYKSQYKPQYKPEYKPPYPPYYTLVPPPLIPPPPPVIRRKKKGEEEKWLWPKFRNLAYFMFPEYTPTWSPKQMVTQFPTRILSRRYRIASGTLSGIPKFMKKGRQLSFNMGNVNKLVGIKRNRRRNYITY